MFALGIDPGLSRCGYGAVDDAGGKLHAVAFGHLTTPPDAPIERRLGTLLDDLEALLDELRPEVVVVERVLFQINVRTAMAVGQASGLALACAARRGLPVAHYSPNEVKQAVAGYGAATKEQVQRMVRTLLDLDDLPRPADRADALALAICHLSGARLRAAVAARPPSAGRRPGAGGAAGTASSCGGLAGSSGTGVAGSSGGPLTASSGAGVAAGAASSGAGVAGSSGQPQVGA